MNKQDLSKKWFERLLSTKKVSQPEPQPKQTSPKSCCNLKFIKFK